MPKTRFTRLALGLVLVAAASGTGASRASAVSAFSPCVRAKAAQLDPNDYNVRTAGVSASSRLAVAIRLREACEHASPHHRYRRWGWNR